MRIYLIHIKKYFVFKKIIIICVLPRHFSILYKNKVSGKALTRLFFFIFTHRAPSYISPLQDDTLRRKRLSIAHLRQRDSTHTSVIKRRTFTGRHTMRVGGRTGGKKKNDLKTSPTQARIYTASECVYVY